MSSLCSLFGSATVIALAACGGDKAPSVPSAPRVPSAPTPPAQPLTPHAASVSIDQRGFAGQIKLDVREQAALTATVRDEWGNVLAEHPISWSSSSPNVATVSSTGVVTGVAPGEATIVATNDGKSDTRTIQVLALNLTTFQLSLLVTDDAGNPVRDATVYEEYYGARPSGCLSCNIPYGGYVGGKSDSEGAFTGQFVADPEAMNDWAGAVHAFGYVTVASLGGNYETDRRFVLGTSTSFTQPVRLHPMRQIAAGDSLTLTIAPTDPVYQALDTSPAEDGTYLCRTIRVLATADGVLSVTAAATGPNVAAPYVELDRPDESDGVAFGQGAASTSVHLGELVEVRVATTIKPGGTAQSFVVRTTLQR